MAYRTEQTIIFVVVINIGLGVRNVFAEENVPRTCPPDYEYFSKGHKCYKVSDSPENWYEANYLCRHEGADLVVINDTETERFVSLLVLKKHPRYSSRYWIGLKEIQKSMTFKWVDGNPLEYSFWRPPGPSNDDIIYPNCVESLSSITPEVPGWNDVSCAAQRMFVCEKPLMVHPACPSGYTSYSEGRKCVRAVHNGTLSWDEAREVCQREGGDLVVIKDDKYNTFVKSLLNDKRVDGWNIFIGDDPKGAVCEQDFYAATSCRNDYWVQDTGRNKCYRVKYREKTFFRAKLTCQRRGGDLAGIPDARSLAYFKDIIEGLDPRSYWYNGWTNHSTTCTGPILNMESPYTRVEGCYTLNPFLCERPTVRDGAVLECPHGYTTFVSSTSGWKITCLMAESNQMQTMEAASNACQQAGGDLFTYEPNDLDLYQFVNYSLIVQDQKYWLNSSCERYGTTTASETSHGMSTEIKTCHSICKHWGNIKDMIQLKNVPDVIQQHVYDSTNPNRNMSLVEMCRTLATNTSQQSHRDWMNTATEVTVIMDRTWNGKDLKKHNTNCGYKQQIDCRTEATFTRPTYLTDEFQTKTTFSKDLIHCLCPTLVTAETISLLKELTTPPENSSAPPQNKLCPCHCHSLLFNPNPSPIELTRILTKIQNELKVDTVELSSKQNKKRSAPDTRMESSVIGYFGILLCLIPVSLLVAMDVCRIIQYLQANKSVTPHTGSV